MNLWSFSCQIWKQYFHSFNRLFSATKKQVKSKPLTVYLVLTLQFVSGIWNALSRKKWSSWEKRMKAPWTKVRNHTFYLSLATIFRTIVVLEKLLPAYKRIRDGACQYFQSVWNRKRNEEFTFIRNWYENETWLLCGRRHCMKIEISKTNTPEYESRGSLVSLDKILHIK